MTVTVAESGERLISALFSAMRAFLSAIRVSRSAMAMASGTRRNFALAAAVCKAAAVIRVGVIVQVGSGVLCLEVVHEAV